MRSRVQQLCVLILCASTLTAGAAGADQPTAAVQQRRRAFLEQLADNWMRAGAPVAWAHAEWKFDEIEPNWAGALAAMYLKRSPAEIAKADAFFEAMPIDPVVDPDMRVCEGLHAYYLFRDDPGLSSAARKRLLELIHVEPAPRRLNPSVWEFGATENHAFMGHVWCLLAAQLDRDRATAERVTRHLDSFVIEHIRKGWLEYNSPCYVEKNVGCLLLLSEWAEDPLLRRKAKLGLDVLFAEHALLSLEGVLGGPACRVYRPSYDGILREELGHNSRYDARCSGTYPMMYMLFGTGKPHFYGVLGAPLLATSTYVPPAAVSALATAGQERGSYVVKARRPGQGHRVLRQRPGTAEPPPEVFNARVYGWVTPDFVLGSFQEVQGRYGAARSLPLMSVLRIAGNPRRTILTDLLPADRTQQGPATVDCVQHKNVSMGRGAAGRAYLATQEFDELIEQQGWLLVRAGETFAAYRVVGSGHTWQHSQEPGLYGDFIRFDRPDAAFVLEAARASDYQRDFARFRADVLDNQIEEHPEGVTYQSCSSADSGPAAEPFKLTLRYGDLPCVDDRPIELESYGMIESPYLSSVWDSGIVLMRFGPHRLTINVNPARSPVLIEEFSQPVELPFETACDAPDARWVPFLNYWRLKPEQWHWDATGGRSGGCLGHDAHLGVRERERGAHDAAIVLRGGEHWTDYAFEADGYAEKGSLGLWVRANVHDEGGGNGRWVQGYHFVLLPSRAQCRLWRARCDGRVIPDQAGKAVPQFERNEFSNPVLLSEGRAPATVAHGRWLHLAVHVRGDTITCLVDGQEVLNAKDRSYPSGSIGFVTYKGEGVRFDNVRATFLPQ
ncbi:MAG: DUF1080 domain-containing protein [Phycisphaerae bacterium]|nr:DUF1080 domain-containing protein [Phycisphaerae bacterium]